MTRDEIMQERIRLAALGAGRAVLMAVLDEIDPVGRCKLNPVDEATLDEELEKLFERIEKSERGEKHRRELHNEGWAKQRRAQGADTRAKVRKAAVNLGWQPGVALGRTGHAKSAFIWTIAQRLNVHPRTVKRHLEGLGVRF